MESKYRKSSVGILCSKLSRWPHCLVLQRSDAFFLDIRSNWNIAIFPFFVFFIQKIIDLLYRTSSFLSYWLDRISINWISNLAIINRFWQILRISAQNQFFGFLDFLQKFFPHSKLLPELNSSHRERSNRTRIIQIDLEKPFQTLFCLA